MAVLVEASIVRVLVVSLNLLPPLEVRVGVLGQLFLVLLLLVCELLHGFLEQLLFPLSLQCSLGSSIGCVAVPQYGVLSL